jgi:hypothetical protein
VRRRVVSTFVAGMGGAMVGVAAVAAGAPRLIIPASMGIAVGALAAVREHRARRNSPERASAG